VEVSARDVRAAQCRCTPLALARVDSRCGYQPGCGARRRAAANRGRGQRRVENRARVAPSSSARRGSWKVRSRSAATWSERASSLTLPVEPAPTCAVAPSGCDGRQVAVPVCRGPPGLAGRRSSSWPPADGHRQAGRGRRGRDPGVDADERYALVAGEDGGAFGPVTVDDRPDLEGIRAQAAPRHPGDGLGPGRGDPPGGWNRLNEGGWQRQPLSLCLQVARGRRARFCATCE